MSSSATVGPGYISPPGPLHVILLAGSVSLFLGALLGDIAYYNSHQIQWANFAAWLNAGAMVFAGLALVFALVNLLRAKRKAGNVLTYFVLLFVTWVLGLITAFVHAKDAWAVMPAGLVLSAVVFVLICITTVIGLKSRSGGLQ